MKKIAIFILMVALILLHSSEIYAQNLTEGNSEWWSSQYHKEGFTHAGNIRVTGSRMSGLMIYKTATIYEYEISDDVEVLYVGTLYPGVRGYNYNVAAAIETITSSYVRPPETFAFQFKIADMNVGLGIKRTYSEILHESRIQQFDFNVKSGDMLHMTPLAIGAFTNDNATIAVYAKIVRIRETTLKVSQTGPITNVYWRLESGNTREGTILLDLNVLPIPSGLKDTNYINNGNFYVNQINENLRGNYKGK